MNRLLSLLLRDKPVYVMTEGYKCWAQIVSVDLNYMVTLDTLGGEWFPSDLLLHDEPLNIWIIGVQMELLS